MRRDDPPEGVYGKGGNSYRGGTRTPAIRNDSLFGGNGKIKRLILGDDCLKKGIREGLQGMEVVSGFRQEGKQA